MLFFRNATLLFYLLVGSLEQPFSHPSWQIKFRVSAASR